MRVNLADIQDQDQFDVCIIGSGPAGITCALQLGENGKRVLILEGGDEEYTKQSQDIYSGTIDGDPYFPLNGVRLRHFGGTSGHWAGWCRPLDAQDFETKGTNRDVAWPIKKYDLDPYLDQARDILEIKRFDPDQLLGESDFAQIFFSYSPPVRFADKFGEALSKSPAIYLVLRANLTEIETNGSAITGLQVADFSGAMKRVRALDYILACGGIENSRLLLWSNHKSNGRLVRNSAMLGTHWMEHPEYNVGEAILSKKFNFKFDERGIVRFSPTQTLIAKEDILNCVVEFRETSYSTAKKIIADIACVAPTYGRWAFKMLNKDLVCATRFRAAWEQEPRSVNRITLGEDRDQFGIPKTILHWRKSEKDLKTVRVVVEKLAQHMAQKDIGRIKIKPWVLGEEDPPINDALAGYHHLGGTRMASTPDNGVVDADCRVFGQSNLFVAGSSVFPSGGFANPTLTIVQLALRLSHAIESRNR